LSARWIVDDVNSVAANAVNALQNDPQQVKQLSNFESSNITNRLRVVHAHMVNLNVFILRLDDTLDGQHLSDKRRRRLSKHQELYRIGFPHAATSQCFQRALRTAMVSTNIGNPGVNNSGFSIPWMTE